MGGTKSKVDGTPDEESETSSQTSESTYRNSGGRHRHGCQSRQTQSPTRREDQSDESTPSPDEILDRPFRYRSRKERLLASLNESSRCKHGDSTNEEAGNGTLSVQEIVDNIQGALHTRVRSNSSLKDKCFKSLKYRTNDGNVPDNVDKNSGRRKSSGKVVASKEVNPSGAEEKIIESLIQPKNRLTSLPRTMVNPRSNTATQLNDSTIKNVPPKPPDLPPIDFSGSDTEDGGQKPIKKPSPTSSMNGHNMRPSQPEPSHLKELKLRFGNDVPQSPLEDNLNPTSIIEQTTPKHFDKPSNLNASPVSNCFSNDVPGVDSLHIFSDTQQPTLVIQGEKNQSKQSSDRRSKTLIINPNGERDSNKNRRKERSANRSSSPCSKIVNINPTNEPISCSDKAEHHKKSKSHEKGNPASCRRTDRHKDRAKHSPATRLRNARVQTSCFGLVDSGVQTLPDLGVQRPSKKDEDADYKIGIDNKAKKVLRRVSMDRSVDRKANVKKGRRYRNGSTQWEEIDLLDNTSCSMLEQKALKSPMEKLTNGVPTFVEMNGDKDLLGCKSINDCQDCFRRSEVCMHMQVIPQSSGERRSLRKSQSRKHSDLLTKESKDNACGDESKDRQRCSCSGSSEKLSAQATYSTSSFRSRELSLLTPFRSSSSIRSRTKPKDQGPKDDDVYRQMEELGLGFLQDGEWVPTDVISRTLWQNLEKCTENCQATWRRRSRSLSHAHPPNGQNKFK